MPTYVSPRHRRRSLFEGLRRSVSQRAFASRKAFRSQLFEQLESRQMLAVGPNPVVFIPGFAGTFADVIGADGNLIAESVRTERMDEWYTQRGLPPSKLALEPFSGTYQNIVQTLDNVGFVTQEEAIANPLLQQSLFVALWDYRVDVAPTDGVDDGVLSNATYSEIADISFDTGLDYLAHTLEQVKAIYGPGTTVDIVTHSTGGLIARSYLQSAAYANRAVNGLPAVGSLVMAGVPQHGVSETWNFMLDDWSDSAASRAAARLIDNAYDRLQDTANYPNGIQGPDSTTTTDDITNPAIDRKLFAQLYVSSTRNLLPSYPVIDLDNNGSLDVVTATNTPETNAIGVGQYNNLLPDLNAAGNIYLDQATQVSIVYSTEADTKDRIVSRVGPSGSFFDSEILPFTDFIGRSPAPSEGWYQDITTANGGDGTVPTFSSIDPFVGDPRVNSTLHLLPIIGALAGTGSEPVLHADLVINEYAQGLILDQIGATHTPADIETGLKVSPSTAAARALALDVIDFNSLFAELKLTASDIANFFVQLGDSLETLADHLNVPGGIPFVNDAISTIASFSSQTDALASKLYKNATVTGAHDIAAIDGVLVGEAAFAIRLDDRDPVPVSVLADANNNSVEDLIVDINTALALAGLSDAVVAELPTSGNASKLQLRTLDPSVATNMDVSTLQVTGALAAPSSGRLGEDVTLTLRVLTQNRDVPEDVEVTVTAAATESNTSLDDLIRDINAAMAVALTDRSLLNELFFATAAAGRIRIAAADSTAVSISISGGEALGFAVVQSADVNPAASDLGLGLSQSANARLAITGIPDLVALLNSIMPVETTLGYNEDTHAVTFNLNLEAIYEREIDLDFSKALDLGFADLNLVGSADAIFQARAGIDLTVGLDLIRDGAGETIHANKKLSELRNEVAFKVAVTSAGAASSSPGTLSIAVKRFDQAAETVTIVLDEATVGDNVNAEDLAFDLSDALQAEGVGIRAAVNNGKIVLVADEPAINQLTISTPAFGFIGAEVSDQVDLVITLVDGTTHGIVLDGAETLGDIKQRIEIVDGAPTGLVVSFVGDQIEITDASTQINENRLVIVAAGNALGTSPAGAGLGILGTTAPSDDAETVGFNENKTLRGEHLLLGALSDQFFVDTANSSLYIDATVDATNVNLVASLGILELEVLDGYMGDVAFLGDDDNATGFSISAALQLSDNGDGDGLLRLSDFGNAAEVIGIAPTFGYGGAATLPLSVPLLPSESPTITLTLQSDPNDPLSPQFDVDAPNLNELVGDFRNLSLSDIASMLRQVVDMLRNSQIDGLNANIPVINQSPNELLGFTDGLLQVAEKLLDGPDLEQLKLLRDQLVTQIDLVSGQSEQLAALESAFLQLNQAIDPAHSYALEITDGGSNVYRTELLPSSATSMDVQAAIDAALGAPDLVVVSGSRGGPFTFVFDATLGQVKLRASSQSGLTVQFEETSSGELVSEFMTTSRLSAALLNFETTVLDLEDEGVDVSAVKLTLGEMTGGVISTANLGGFLTELLEQELGLPVAVAVSFVDADDAQAGNQHAIKLELDINPHATKSAAFDLSLDDFGPIRVATGGAIDVTFGGEIDLDVGFNFASLTPYVFDSTRFAITADIDSTLDVTAKIRGFEAGLDGTAELRAASDPLNPASIAVSLNSAPPTDGNTIGAIPLSQLFDGGLANKFTFALDGEAAATFNATLPGVGKFTDAIEVNYTLGGTSPTLDYFNLTAGVESYLQGLTDLSNMSLDQLISGTRTVLSTIESGLTSDLLSNLPLIGEGVDLGASFVGELQGLVDQFETLINSTDDSVDKLVGEIQDLIFAALGPAGAGILTLDRLYHDDPTQDNTTEVADSRDVEVFISDLATTPAKDAEFFINLQLAGRDVIQADFDLGLDAVVFDFESTGGVELSWDYNFTFGFGISVADGFFFQLNPNTNFDDTGFNDGTGGSPEIALNAEVSLQPGTSLKGELFFLNLVAESNPREDLNGNGVLDAASLNEAIDGIDYNRDGDTNDVLTEADRNGDGRLSRGTGLSGQIFIDIHNPDADSRDRLTLDELLDGGPLLSAGIRTEAFVDLALTADTDAGKNLPKLTTDLTVDWGLSYSTSKGFVSGSPEVAFHSVSLDLGSFFESIAGPAFEIFSKYTAPARPVINFLRQEVPGFSDLSEAVGGGKITFLDLGAYASPRSAQQVAQARKALDAISAIFDAVDEIKSFAGADGILINFGDFILSGGTKTHVTNEAHGNNPAKHSEVQLAHAASAGTIVVRVGGVVLSGSDYQVIHTRVGGSPATRIKFTEDFIGAVTVDYAYTLGKIDVTDATTQVSVSAGTTSPMFSGSGGSVSSGVLTQIGASGSSSANTATSKLKKLNRSATSGGYGLKIPLLSDPFNAFKLLTGETVDLLQWDIPELDLNIPFSSKFGPIGPTPIFAQVGGNVGAKIDFSVGFDTRGVSETGNFLDGLYFGDLANVTTGRDINEVEFSLGINAGVGIDLVFAGVYLTGGVDGRIGFDWNDLDGNGKLYFDELATLAQIRTNPYLPGACVFDAHGSLDAKIGVEWWLTPASGYIPIINEQIFSFDYTCDTGSNVAQLTKNDPSFANNTLVINAGPYAGRRSPGSSTDGSETFEVTQQPSGAIQVTYDLVAANGSVTKVSREFTGAQRIYFNGGAGNDKITIDPSVTIPVTLIGGRGNDILIGGSGNTTFAGGSGNDVVTSRGGVGTTDRYLFENNWGQDTISDAGGHDTIDFSGVTVGLNITHGVETAVAYGGNTIHGPGGAALVGIEGLVGGSGTDTLTVTHVQGTGAENVWTLNQLGGGNVNGELTLAGFENLTGGNPHDRFVFAGGRVTGQINGQGGNDTLDFSAASQPIELDLSSGKASSEFIFPFIGNIDIDYMKSFANIDQLLGSTANDTLIGPNDSQIWNLMGVDTGDVGGLNFSSFENLTGSNASDTFVIGANGRLTGNLQGTKTAGAVDADTVDLSAKTSSLNISLTGRNQGNVVEVLNFGGIESVIGGSANDHFVISPLAGLTGTMSGGGGMADHADYSSWSTAVQVNLSTSSANFGSVATMEFLTGGAAGDTLIGNGNANRIIGMGGGDTIDGKGGDNLLIGDSATVTPTNSAIATISSIRTLSDLAGNDTIMAGNGNNLVLPGLGNDSVSVGNGDNVIGGDQVLVARSGSNLVSIESIDADGTGHDTITTGSGRDVIIAGDGNDFISDSGGSNVIIGDRGRVLVQNGEVVLAASQLSLLSGADSITTGAGRDAIIAGGGADIVHAGAGDNYVLGDDGQINFIGGLPTSSTLQKSSLDGNDVITTLAGTDVIYTGDGDNQVFAGDGNDDVFAGIGIDTIEGQGGNDFLVGDLGDDTIRAGTGDDVAFGGLVIGVRSDYELGTNDFTLPPEFSENEALHPTGYTPALNITPAIVAGLSIDGVEGDGRDVVDGGEGNDVLFGGWDVDELRGGAGVDYVDAGASNDTVVEGNEGDDVVRGGAGHDEVRGGDGVDQVYGDAGDDMVYGETGTAAMQAGQRLYGGAGRDTLYAYGQTGETSAVGDQLFGGADEDSLYGSPRQELLNGGSDDDYLGGDELVFNGTDYVPNPGRETTGADDTLFGGSGDDQLYGHAGNDTMWGGGGTDYIVGGKGSDTQYGGAGIDLFVLYTGATARNEQDAIDGHFGNAAEGDAADDNATDILVIDGTQADEEILIGRQTGAAATEAAVLFDGVAIRVDMLDSDGNLRVEQFRISGLGGDDTLGFYTDQAVQSGALTVRSGFETINLDSVAASKDWVGVFDGNSGNDTLLGSTGRDRLDGGRGSDVAYGFAGDDRLWGDGGEGSTADHDTLYAGQGNDDLVGGQGTNKLYAWSFDPRPALVPPGTDETYPDRGFGVFVDENGALFSDDGDLNDNGIFDPDDSVAIGPVRMARIPEVTGLNRMLGSQQGDQLFGGTTLDFMYGNGGTDELYRADGTTFDSADGGLAGDEWKEYARESDQVWYIGGSNAEDEIRVDFVTEPGLLTDHHVISRRTNNNGNNTFNIDVRLDFSATDESGNEIWSASDLAFKLDQLQTVTDPELRSAALADVSTNANAPASESDLLSTLLPPEGDFLVILVDALGGDDDIDIGPTVQKSVWIDAGGGNDRVTIGSGNSILVDKSERSLGTTGTISRNDIPRQAFDLLEVNDVHETVTFDGTALPGNVIEFTGLSIDSPTDVDWYAFALAATPDAASKLELASGSPIDELSMEIYTVADVDPLTGEPVDGALPLRSSEPNGDRSIIENMSGLLANTRYLLKISSPNLVPTLYDLRFSLSASVAPSIPSVNLSLRDDTTRRDVILGGDGDDILQGGGGEDWIFGNAGNDVLTGGTDRGASDLLFGGPGNDTFQIIPDRLPLLGNQPNTNFDPGTVTYITTASDQFIGGEGTDRVLYLGGDKDPVGRDVNDFTAMRYNAELHRYEFTSLVWDINEQAFQTNIDSAGRTVWEQHYLFYQTRDVEQTQFEMGAGDDVVHLDSGFQFLPLDGTFDSEQYETWGFDLGDYQQGAREQIFVFGGAGDDQLYGTPHDDFISGGAGNDTLVGGTGNDSLLGDEGDDQLLGATLPNDLLPPLPTTTSSGGQAYAYLLATPLGAFIDSDSQVNWGTEFVHPEQFEAIVPGLAGQNENDRLSNFASIGDFNGDGYEDFVAGGTASSYVLFGPVELDGISSVVDEAGLVISHAAIGRPAEKHGDLNGDGLGDLVLVNRTRERILDSNGDFQGNYHSPNTVITVVWGAERPGLDRLWTRDLASSLDSTNTLTIKLDDTSVSFDTQPFVSTFNFDGDARDDLLVFTEQTSKNGRLGHVFAGSQMVSDLTVGDAVAFYTPATIGLPQPVAGLRYRATVLGDVDGDGRDELGFDDYSRITLDGSTAILATATPFRLSGLADLNRDGYDDIAITYEAELNIHYGSLAGVSMTTPNVVVTGSYLQPTSGDFNGDGKIDLATISGAETNQTTSRALVYFSISERVAQLSDEDADASFPFAGQQTVTRNYASFRRGAIDVPNAAIVGSQGITFHMVAKSNFQPVGPYADQILRVSGIEAIDLEFIGNQARLRIQDVTVFPNGTKSFIEEELFWDIPDLSNDFHAITLTIRNEAPSAELFIDGVSLGNHVIDPFWTTGMDDSGLTLPATFVGSPVNSSNDLDLDELAIYRRGISADEAMQIAAKGVTGTSFSPDHLYLIDESSGEMLDSIGNQNATFLEGLTDPRVLAMDFRGSTEISPSIDLNGDGIDDLVLAAGLSENLNGNRNAGRIFATYGAPATTAISSHAHVLENFSVAGSGSFVVDRGTSRAELFDNDGLPFSLTANEERWFQFTTLGDGQAGDTIYLDGNVSADLMDARGVVLARGNRAFDLRAISAGTYYLLATATTATDLTIAFVAPARGQMHTTDETSDRDRLLGGPGRDVLNGGGGLDRILGQEGIDTFVAESIEAGDAASGESLTNPTADADFSFNSSSPLLDQVIEIHDLELQAAIHAQLGYPVTNDTVVHSSLTASQVSSITSLDASGVGIESLAGIEQLTQVRTLDLSHNAALTEITALANLSALQTLDLSSTGVEPTSNSTLETLEQLANLNSLKMSVPGDPTPPPTALEDFEAAALGSIAPANWSFIPQAGLSTVNVVANAIANSRSLELKVTAGGSFPWRAQAVWNLDLSTLTAPVLTFDTTANNANTTDGRLWVLVSNGGTFREVAQIDLSPAIQQFSINLATAPVALTANYQILFMHYGRQNTFSLIDNLTIIETATGELANSNQEFVFAEGQQVTVPLSTKHKWQVVDEDDLVVASGTSASVAFTPTDNGFYRARFSRNGGSTYDPWFPILVRNVSPTVAQIPVFSSTNEGQSIALGTREFVGSELQIPVIVDGLEIDRIHLTDPSSSDRQNLSVEAQVIDPAGSVHDLAQAAIKFNDHALQLDSQIFDGRNSLTTAFWLKTTSAGLASAQTIVSVGATEAVVLKDAETLVVKVAGVDFEFTIPTLADEAYHHIAVVRDTANESLQVFVDGTPSANSHVVAFEPLSAAPGSVLVGQQFGALGLYPLMSSLDELTIWDRLLTGDEISAIQSNLFDRDSVDLVGYWPMNEGGGQVAADRSRYGRDAHLKGVADLGFHYPLQNSYDDASENGGPSITPAGGTITANGYAFGTDQGPSLSGAVNADTYTIEMEFEIDSVSGYKRLIDFKNRGIDDGLYVLNGFVNFYDASTYGQFPVGSSSVQVDTQHLLRIERDGATNEFTVYLDNVLQFSFVDDLNAAVFTGPNNIIHFLRDDSLPSENPSGTLFSVRTIDMQLTAVSSLAWDQDAAPGTDGGVKLINNGDYIFRISARDDDDGFVTQEVPFTVGNLAPSTGGGANILGESGDSWVGQTIRSTASHFSDPGVEDRLNYLWEVTNDNGQPIYTGSGFAFEFTPQFAGHYTLSLTVSDEDGGVSLPDTSMYEVKPIVAIELEGGDGVPAAPTQGTIITLTPSGSSPIAPEGLLRGTEQTVTRTYLWDLTHDGSPLTLPTAVATAENLQFLPTLAGNYVATLTITDSFDDGTSTSTISNSNTYPFNVDTATVISIVTPTAASLEGDVLLFSIAGLPQLTDNATRTVEWAVSGGAVTIVPVEDQETFSFRPIDNSTLVVAVTVTDTLDGFAFTRTAPPVTITIENATPTLIVDGVAGVEGTAMTLAAEVFDVGSTDMHTFVIDWGDGSADSSGDVSGGAISESHTYIQDGSYTVTLTVNDGISSREVTRTVVVSNSAPIAIDDSLPIAANQTLANLNVLANDSDAGVQDALTLFSFDAISEQGAIVSLTGGLLTYNPQAAVALQQLSAGQSLIDTFTYVARDDAGGQDTATVSITVSGVNEAPVAVKDMRTMLATESTVALNLLDNDRDVDVGDTLSLDIVDGSSHTPAVGLYGTLAWDATGAATYSLDTNNPSVLALRGGESLTDVFALSTVDALGFAAPSQLTIVVNGTEDAPIAVDDANSTPANERLTTAGGSVLQNDSDPDQDDTFVVTAVNGEAGQVGVQFQLPSGALLRVKSDGDYEYDPHGTFDYLPLGTFAEDSFTYRITDSEGISATATVTITINGTNEVPTGALLSGNTITTTATANAIVGSFVTIDPDQDDTHVYAVTEDASGAFGIIGANLVVANAANLTIGTHLIVVSTTDQNGVDSLGIEQVFQVIVKPAPDTTAPTSSIQALPNQADDLIIPLTISGSDSGPLGSEISGIAEYRLYVSEDAGEYVLFATLPSTELTTEFIATSNHNYFFRSVAVDVVGNVETKNSADAQTTVGDFDPPETHVVSAVANSLGLFNVIVTGTESGGGKLSFFDLYVSVDGGVARLVGSAGGGVPDASSNYHASIPYQGISDGQSHSYRFFSNGRDSSGNIEPAPRSRNSDVKVTNTFANVGLRATGIDVQLGSTQRSYIRNLDVLFNSEAGLDDLLVTGRVAVERFATNATDVTPGTGTALNPLTDFSVDRVGDRLRLDFDVDGITDSSDTEAGDGFYRVLVDVDRNGSFADSVDGLFEFHRILGDANGDAVVDGLDAAVVASQLGQFGLNLDGDVNGDGVVNGDDDFYVFLQELFDARLAEALKPLLDD
ncbi:MAG: Ig-like domain-containing protein [Pirellulaceae bacterium]